MANVQITDLVAIGRGGKTYTTTFSDLKESVLDGQEASNDAKYVLVGGDTMTGSLILDADPTQALHAATKQYVDAIETSVSVEVNSLSVGLQAEVARSNAAETTLEGNLDAEILRANAAETTLESNLNDEIARATAAESNLNTKIDDLVLDGLSNVSVDGASEDQHLVYNGTNWVSRTIEGVADSLLFQSAIDCTTEEVPDNPVAGWYYFNTVDGTAVSSWTNITTVTSGDRVVYGNDNQWHILGNIHDGGNVTLDSLAVTTADADGGGALAYNNASGEFTFTPADLDTRVPMDLSKLPVLPAI